MEVFIQRAESHVYVFALKECHLIVSRKLDFHLAGLAMKAQEPAQPYP